MTRDCHSRMSVFRLSRNRIVKKHINIRVEHIQHSKCRDEFLQRVKRNEALRRRAKESGHRVTLKRQVSGHTTRVWHHMARMWQSQLSSSHVAGSSPRRTFCQDTGYAARTG